MTAVHAGVTGGGEPPPTGTLWFDSRFQNNLADPRVGYTSRGGAYQVSGTGTRQYAVVDDPLGVTDFWTSNLRKVLRLRTSTGTTMGATFRQQFVTGATINAIDGSGQQLLVRPGAEFYCGGSIYLPSDFPTVTPTNRAHSWIMFSELHANPYAGTSYFEHGKMEACGIVRTGSAPSVVLGASSNISSPPGWNDGAPPELTWIDFVYRIKIATQVRGSGGPYDGIYTVWLDNGTDDWTRIYHNGTAQTRESNDGDGYSFHYPKLYGEFYPTGVSNFLFETHHANCRIASTPQLAAANTYSQFPSEAP